MIDSCFPHLKPTQEKDSLDLTFQNVDESELSELLIFENSFKRPKVKSSNWTNNIHAINNLIKPIEGTCKEKKAHKSNLSKLTYKFREEVTNATKTLSKHEKRTSLSQTTSPKGTKNKISRLLQTMAKERKIKSQHIPLVSVKDIQFISIPFNI
jgi:hypothetical protein